MVKYFLALRFFHPCCFKFLLSAKVIPEDRNGAFKYDEKVVCFFVR